MRTLSNRAKFSVIGPYFQRIIFRPQWPLPIALNRLGTVASLKIFDDWKYDSPLFGPCLLWQNGWMDHDAT